MSTDARQLSDRLAEPRNAVEPVGDDEPRDPVVADEPINILLVDDETKNLAVLESVLDDPGYRLVRAESADQALMALIAEEFALIVLDIQMPGMNGFELAQMIKQRKRTASLPIIFLTAYYSEDSHVIEGYNTGAVDYLHKPINPVILRSKVAVFVELYRKTRECGIANRILLAEVAERRRAQEELRQLTENLERRVAQRTAELLAANVALRASEERFRLALKNSRILVCTTDRDLVYTWVSEQGAGCLWRPSVGRRDEELVPPDQAKALVELKRRVLETGIGEHAEISLDIDGRRLHYDLTVDPLLDDRGERAGVAIAAMEITGLKRAEEALKDADRRKDEFLATLAHELRNPLAPIRNAVEVLRAKTVDPARLEWAKDVLDRQSQHMSRLVDDLLDISRITNGKLELRMAHVRLKEIIQGALETCGPLIERCGHQLTLVLPREDLIVNGDVTRLSQSLSNLLNNAAKYTRPGGSIWLTAERAGAEVCISVKDNGVGIPAEMLPYVFEMFTQVDRHLDRSQGGLGIGLRLVKWLVEMHGGSIDVQSDGADQGSEFIIRLPVVGESPTVDDAAPTVFARASITSVRVLVVDDNADNAESLRLLVELMGHDVRVAHDGIEGIDVANEFRPDVILLDIGMPKLDGHEVCRRIRSQDWGRNMVLVAQTGWGQEDDRRRTASAGFDHHLIKPVSHAELCALLTEIADQRAAAGNGRPQAAR